MHWVKTIDGDGFARLLADGEPELENVFEFREMKSAAGGRRIIVSVK